MKTSDKFIIAFLVCNAVVYVLSGVCIDAGLASTGANFAQLAKLMGIASPLLLVHTILRSIG